MPFLQTLTSLFSTSGNPSSAAASRHRTRPSAATSISAGAQHGIQQGMDAFSLPTTRYPGVANGVNDSAASSPGPSRRASGSNYTAYPPAKESYQPAALTYYPPLSHTYHRLRVALSSTFPELVDTLNYPVDPLLFAQFEDELSLSLPPAVRDSFLVADGQDLEAAISLGATGSFFGLMFLPLEEVMREWAFWRAAEHDPLSGQNAAVLATMVSVPPGWIRGQYACRGWVPLMSDRTGNYVGVDLDPGPGGARGQVIVFGRDFDRKCVLWKGEGEGGWGRWLAALVDELEGGQGAGAGWDDEGKSSISGAGNSNSNGNGESSDSDEEAEAGYTDYGGGGSYGEAARALRLTGKYKGWTTLEAWWDKSVNKWEEMGMGMDVEEVERGLAEARRLTGADQEEEGSQFGGSTQGKGKGREVEGMDVGLGRGTEAASVEVPVIGPLNSFPQPPSTPTPHDSDALIPPHSPSSPSSPIVSASSASGIPRISATASSPRRVITPLPSSTDHPLSSTATVDSRGFLSPPMTGSSQSTSGSRLSNNNGKRRASRPVPAPSPLDLPTRADVQAMSAIAMAQDSGLRGGWVMNPDSTGAGRRGAARAAAAQAGYNTGSGSGAGSGSGTGFGYGQPRVSRDGDGMVDIDLEGGRLDRVGGSADRWRIDREEMERQREEEKLALAGVEHRRPSPNLLGRNSWSSAGTGTTADFVSASGTRSPSPLSMPGSGTASPSAYDPSNPYASPAMGYGYDSANSTTSAYASSSAAGTTPRAGMREREDPMLAHAHVGLGLRPPPAASQQQGPSWEKSEDGDREVIRASAAAIAGRGRPSEAFYGAPRVERESSTTSLSSETGLLAGAGATAAPSASFGAGGGGRKPDLSVNVAAVASASKGDTRGADAERAGTPPVVYSSPVHSPSRIAFDQGAGASGASAEAGDVEGMMQDICLDDGPTAAGAGAGTKRGEGEGDMALGSPTTPTASKRPVVV